VRRDVGPLEHALKVLGPDAKGFGSTFTQGHWGDIWLQSVLGIPVPPLLPGPGNPAPASAHGARGVHGVFAEATR